MRFLRSAEQKKQLKPVRRELHLSTAKQMTGGYRPWSKFNAHSWSILNARRHIDSLRSVQNKFAITA